MEVSTLAVGSGAGAGAGGAGGGGVFREIPGRINDWRRMGRTVFGRVFTLAGGEAVATFFVQLHILYRMMMIVNEIVGAHTG